MRRGAAATGAYSSSISPSITTSRPAAGIVRRTSAASFSSPLSLAEARASLIAFSISRWSGLGLIGFYAYIAGRLAGESLLRALLQAAAVAAIGGLLIGIKALVH